jgi:hypothetical protein
VVTNAQKAGHEVAVLSRSCGVDVRSADGMPGVLNAADAVVDVTHSDTIEQKGGGRVLDRGRSSSAARRRRGGRGAHRDAVVPGDRQNLVWLLRGQARTRARRSQGPVQTVAARTVAEVLLELAEGAPSGQATDLTGPQKADLVALARAFVQHRGARQTAARRRSIDG